LFPTELNPLEGGGSRTCAACQFEHAPTGYQAALATNPDLTFGNYVAATRLSQHLGSRFPNITRDAILNGLASGRSLGRTLQDLGLSERESKDARKQVDKELKDARKH
jgi:hypothetical protein